MECTKCHKILPDNTLVCPYCHKVLALSCPNCHTTSLNSVCTKCGYILLEKCAKCGRMVSTSADKCKCGFPVATSIAYNECEIDDFASVIIKFAGLKHIRAKLGSQELYAKFLLKLKNLLSAQLKNINAHVIIYGDIYTVNFNKELSFPTSTDKAVRLALKLVRAFSGLNTNIIDQFGTSLKMKVMIIKKSATELLVNKSFESNVKLMVKKVENVKYLQGMQVIIDQYCQDTLKNYQTDSLYTIELNGATLMFYEILLDNYIVPPDEADNSSSDLSLNKNKQEPKLDIPDDIYGFKVFDINAKCTFKRCSVEDLPYEIDINNKILSLRANKECNIKTEDLVKIYESFGFRAVYVSCTEEMCYKPWGFFEKLFKAYFNLPSVSGLIDKNADVKQFELFKALITGQPKKNRSPEDARFSYFEQFIKFISSLKRHAFIIDGFENIDDTSIQAIELFFDKYVKVYNNFVFITDMNTPVHSKIKSLLQTFLYKEVTLLPVSMDKILANIKDDASDFIQSFYYEKIKENFNGSKIYFEHAMKFLMDKDVLTRFEKRLIIKNNSSFMLPKNLTALIRTRLKTLKDYPDASMILAYSVYLGERLDFVTLEKLGINEPEKNSILLDSKGFTFTKDNVIYINNYNLISPMIQASLKLEIEEYLVKNILSKIGNLLDNTTKLLLMGKLSMFKEQCLMLWKNAQLSISNGDYDAYLKNCLGYLAITDKISENISAEDIEANKKEIFNNILVSLYAYSPSKIYSIENLLLMDAINSGDNEKIIKLSNLMLQGALITSNYTEAQSLLHNILTRMPNPSLIVDGAINTKFLLLSLVNIEILFNIGDYKNCISVAEELLSVIKPGIIEKIKPANFSVNLFVSHLMETFRLAVLAILLSNKAGIYEFISKVESALNSEFEDKECISAIKEFLAGKNYTPSNTENATPFSKVIFLILKELTELKKDYKAFAQNIYQSKLLAVDIHQTQLEYICDLLIGYAYGEIGIAAKAQTIIKDVLEKSENSAIFNVVMIARYLMSINKLKNNDFESALLIVNDTLADIQKYNNQAQVFYALFEKLFIDIAIKQKLKAVNTQIEYKKLLVLSPNGELERIIKSKEQVSEEAQIAQEPTPKEDMPPELFDDGENLNTEIH